MSALKAIDVDVIPSGDVIKAMQNGKSDLNNSNHGLLNGNSDLSAQPAKAPNASCTSTGSFIPDVTKDCYINESDLIQTNGNGLPETIKLLKENFSEKVKFNSNSSCNKVQSPLFSGDDFTFSDEGSDHDGYASDRSTKGKGGCELLVHH